MKQASALYCGRREPAFLGDFLLNADVSAISLRTGGLFPFRTTAIINAKYIANLKEIYPLMSRFLVFRIGCFQAVIYLCSKRLSKEGSIEKTRTK